MYGGEHFHGVDSKRRVQIPAKWKPAEENAELTLQIWEDPASKQIGLRVLPPRQLQLLMDKLEAMPTSQAESVSLRRTFARNSEQIVIDKAGRICIPDRMAKEAGIGDDVVMLGAVHWFEIWSVERQKMVLAADKLLATEGVKKL